jgi:hypothetical protein
MNPRVLPLVALLAAIAVCAWFFLSSGPSPSAGNAGADSQWKDGADAERSADAAGKISARENSADSTAKKPAVNWKRFEALANFDFSGDWIPKVSEEDISRFLAKHGETAVNLVAIFEKTNDRRWLDRALEFFPNSPVVLLVAVKTATNAPAPKPGESYQRDEQRTALIERFKAADPNNPLPWIFSAQELFKAKQTAEGIGEIRAALERPAFYTYAIERVDSTRQLYEDLGIHPLEASILSMAGQSLPHMSAAIQSSRSLMEWQKSAADSGDTAAAADALRLTYDLGRTFATPEASRTLIGQLVGISMEARALKTLSAEAQPEWLTVTPAQKENMKGLTDNLEWALQSHDEPLLAEYLRRLRDDGELSALTWLKARRK